MFVAFALPTLFPRLLEKDPYSLGIGGRIKQRFGLEPQGSPVRPAQPQHERSYMSEVDGKQYV